MKQRPWTMQEIRFVIENHAELPFDEICKHLDRTAYSVERIFYEHGFRKRKNVYALYKGDELLASGTVEEIAKQMNILPKQVRHYQTPHYKQRARSQNVRSLVKIS